MLILTTGMSKVRPIHEVACERKIRMKYKVRPIHEVACERKIRMKYKVRPIHEVACERKIRMKYHKFSIALQLHMQ